MKVTIDFDDDRIAGSATAVINNLRDPNCRVAAEAIADQIEAQLPKPKPDEPTGLGTVVVDGKGNRWVRAVQRRADSQKWCTDTNEGMTFDWAEYDRIDAVRVLSEGVAS